MSEGSFSRVKGREVRHACKACGFQLWEHLGQIGVCEIGLYDDARFPGRLIVSLIEHYEHLEDAPDELASAFIRDVQFAARVLRDVTGSDRINVAILGNQEPHVHAHVIPRMSSTDPLPQHSPWDDPRPRAKLEPVYRRQLVKRLTEAFDCPIRVASSPVGAAS